MLVFMEISYSIKTQVQVLHLKFIYSEKTTKFSEISSLFLTGTTAKLLLLKVIHLFAREVWLVKKLEIEQTKTT